MTQEFMKLNAKLVKIFNDVRSIEEQSLAQSPFADINLRDMHTIEAIALKEKQTVSQIAHRMYLSPGSMTKIIDKLVARQYVMRRPSITDRRIINLGLTVKGQAVSEAHAAFHEAMCQNLTKGLTKSEVLKLSQAVDNLLEFLEQKSTRYISGEIKQHGRN